MVTIRVDNPNRPIALQTGDIVVVRRTQQQGGLIELSVKELELGEAETLYLPRSKSKRHQPSGCRKISRPTTRRWSRFSAWSSTS